MIARAAGRGVPDHCHEGGRARRSRGRHGGVIVYAAFATGLVALAFVVLAISPPLAGAGTFSVRQCDTAANGNAQPAAPDVYSWGLNGSYFSGYNICGSEWGYGLGVYSDNPAPRGSAGGYYFNLPAGMRFLGGYAEVDFWNTGGYEPRLSVSDGSASHTYLRKTSTNGFQGISWSPPSTYTNTRQLWLWEACVRQSSDWCQGQNASDKALGRHFSFSVQDYASPSSGSLTGSLVSGGWKNGSYSVGYSGSDPQSGVQYTDLYVNGSHASRDTSSCPGVGGGWYGRFRPCPSSASISRTYNVSQGAFVQGANQVRGCVSDLAPSGGANTACTNATVSVDTVAPQKVAGLAVVGGEGWRANDDFDLTWSPPGGQHAPLVGVAYRITKVGGGYDSGRQYAAGATSRLELEDRLPGNGHFQVKVWLRDGAGNESESNGVVAELRIDETVPPDSEPERANGWISRSELPYAVRWSRAPDHLLGPSGLNGYAVVIDRSEVSDPCVTEEHQSATCSPSEINQPGVGSTERTIADLEEGSHWVHVVAVTGAGVKQGEIQHTELRVDKVDPTSSLSGAQPGWSNRDVTLTASAADALSGMDPVGDDNGQPRTVIAVNGREFAQNGSQSATTIAAEGSHAVRWYARDLAGNEGGGGEARVRIDKTAPQIAFENTQSSDDPELIRAPFVERLSGIATGVIEYRRVGSEAWSELATKIEADALEARVPSDSLAEDDYDFRATASDVAGNVARTSSRRSGERMRLRLPVKALTSLRAAIEGKSEQATVRYRKRVAVSGVLREGERDLAGERVLIRESYDAGSQDNQREYAAKTNGQGEFSVKLPTGPSRRIRAVYEGTKRHTKAQSSQLRLNVRGAVAFKLKRARVRAGKAARFSGRVKSAGASLPRGGKLVEVQFFDASKKRWRTVDRPLKANAKGRFRKRYRFGRFYTRRTKIRFRAFLTPENGWPYGPRASKPRRVVVKPAR